MLSIPEGAKLIAEILAYSATVQVERHSTKIGEDSCNIEGPGASASHPIIGEWCQRRLPSFTASAQ